MLVRRPYEKDYLLTETFLRQFVEDLYQKFSYEIVLTVLLDRVAQDLRLLSDEAQWAIVDIGLFRVNLAVEECMKPEFDLDRISYIERVQTYDQRNP